MEAQIERRLEFNFLQETSMTNRLVDLLLGARKKKGLVRQGNLFTQETEETELRKMLFAISALLHDYRLYSRFKMNINGKERDLSVPCPVFQEFCDKYLVPLIKSEHSSPWCHGAERGWTPKRSLEEHVPVSCALSLDMKSAFPNLSYDRVLEFYYKIYGDREAAKFLADISTVQYEKKRGLPQGSSFSNPLFNRVLKRMDEVLAARAEARGMRYSRWVDDVTITSPEPRVIEEFLGAVELTGRFMPVSPSKVYFQTLERLPLSDSDQEHKVLDKYGDIYLLGHKIVNGRCVVKNSDEEREMNKNPPLKFDEWFNGSRKYKSWL